MFEITLLRSASFVGMMMLCFNSSAQSYVTYNHDATKMNQITVQEIGVGGLTPALYYDVFHNSYQKSDARKNKLGFRSLAGVSSYQQVDVADSIKAYLTQRAEIEALNVADRQIDIAWLAEGDKITDKLTAFEANINRIVGAGGSLADKSRWEEYCNMYKTAIKVTQDAYMPNAQRKSFAAGNDMVWKREGKREWDKYCFGIFGCWAMDEAGNLDYVPEESYTEEMWNELNNKSRAKAIKL